MSICSVMNTYKSTQIKARGVSPSFFSQLSLFSGKLSHQGCTSLCRMSTLHQKEMSPIQSRLAKNEASQSRLLPTYVRFAQDATISLSCEVLFADVRCICLTFKLYKTQHVGKKQLHREPIKHAAETPLHGCLCQDSVCVSFTADQDSTYQSRLIRALLFGHLSYPLYAVTRDIMPQFLFILCPSGVRNTLNYVVN